MNLTAAFKQSWQQLQPVGGPVLLAVSGGLDSMALAHLFLEARTAFAVAHCNFGLRGEESDADEAFVQRWCDDRGIRFFAARFDTAAKAAEAGTGLQETARNLRYAWFETLRADHHFTAVCTAHHADDNAETMLINLVRGTGIAGLHGIPSRNGWVLRPLLFAARSQLLQYAQAHGIAWREDGSNSGDDYLRNALRHRVLPLLEAQLPGVAGRMLDTSRRIGEAELIYQRAIEQERKKLLQPRGADYYVPVKLLRHRTPLRTICYELFRPFGFTAQQMPLLTEQLLFAESGRYLASPTHRIIRNRDFLIVTALRAADTDFVPVEHLEQELATVDHLFHFSLRKEPPAQLDVRPEVAYLDADRLEAPLLLRRWKTGDYFYPLGMSMKKKKLSRFFIDQKLPVNEKERVWVLESNKRIVWVCGLRIDERFRVRPGTAQTLKITMAPAAR